MRKLSEDDVKKELGIESFRNLSKDNIIKFVSMIPEMDKEVAMKIIEQFPEYRKLAKDAFENLKEEYKFTLNSNKESQEKVFNSIENIEKILENELDRDDLTPEERREIFNLLSENSNKAIKKDSENKSFLNSLYRTSIAGISVVVIGALMWTGAKLNMEKNNNEK